MENMQLTAQEVQNIINHLADMPYKYAAGLMIFFQSKINELQDAEKTEQGDASADNNQ